MPDIKSDYISLVDSHCHLDYLYYRGHSVAEIIKHANLAGVSHLLSVATELKHNNLLSHLCCSYPGVYRSVGVHPCYVQNEPNITSNDIVNLCLVKDTINNVVAIGETGLDYVHNTDYKTLQHTIFREHIFAAQITDMPLIIHTRAADDYTIRILSNAYEKQPFRGVFHCFTGSEHILTAAREMDFYISITGIITYKNTEALKKVIPRIPLNRIMIETDSPYLAPVPHRSKTCEPFMIVHIAQCLAEILDISVKNLAQQTTNNFFQLFNRIKL